MIKLIQALCGVVILLACCSPVVCALDKTSWEFDVQTSYFNFNAASTNSNGQIALSGSEQGMLNGLKISYLRQNIDADRDFRIDGYIQQGTTSYSGLDSSGNPLVGTSANLIIGIETLTMYDYLKFMESQLYCGLGYRRWYRGISADSNGASFNEVYSWLYVPVGVRYSHVFSKKFNCELDFSARLTLAGMTSISNLVVNGANYNVDLRLGDGYGADLRVPFNYQINPALGIVVTPWLDYYSIGASKWYAVGSSGKQVMEPDSRTIQCGSDFGLKYTF